MTPRRHDLARPTAAARAPLAWALTALLLLPVALATTYLERTPEEMALAAAQVFVGTVATVTVTDEGGTPWTEVTFTDLEWVANELADDEDDGDAAPSSVTLRFLGGALPSGERLTVSGLPRYVEGQLVLLFAYDAPGAASPVVGVRQGSWTLEVAGARSEDGDYLTVPAEGRLQRGATGASVEEVVAAVRALREAGSLPEGPPPAPAEPDAGPDAAGEPDGTPEEAPAAEASDVDPEGPEAADAAGATPPEPAGADGPEAPAVEPEAPGAAAPPDLPPLVVRYAVDESGGPLLLSTAVNRAAAAWEAAASGAVELAPAEPDEAGSAPVHEVGYGPAELFGPDALSLTLSRSGSAGTEVLVSPSAGSLLEPVLVHELGVLIGLPETDAGVMSHAVVAGAVAPTEADVAALDALRTFRPEDLNRDGVVDFYDLDVLARSFGASGVNLAADLNGDGQVDAADLALLEAAYRFLPPSEQPPTPR